MAYHVLSATAVMFECEQLEDAQAIRQHVAGAEKIVEGPVEFLRHIALKKFGQKPSQYPSNVEEKSLARVA